MEKGAFEVLASLYGEGVFLEAQVIIHGSLNPIDLVSETFRNSKERPEIFKFIGFV